jgi:hypothetical protein
MDHASMAVLLQQLAVLALRAGLRDLAHLIAMAEMEAVELAAQNNPRNPG